MYQPFGSGLGHIGSTSNLGALIPVPPWARAFFSSTLWLTPSAARRAMNPAPIKTLRRFMTCVLPHAHLGARLPFDAARRRVTRRGTIRRRTAAFASRGVLLAI